MVSLATISLSEALSSIAFNQELSGPMILAALDDGRLGIGRRAAQDRLEGVVDKLCDAGHTGRIKFWGVNNFESARSTQSESELRQLDQIDFVEFRLFVAGTDILASGANEGNEFSDSFAASSATRKIDRICVDRVSFEKLKAETSGSAVSTNGSQSTPQVVARSNGKGLPRLPDRKLTDWWCALNAADRDLSRDVLHKRCVTAHPNHSIARQRVRDILPKRKPGPRPITPETTA